MQPILLIGTFLVLLALRTIPWPFNFVGMRGKRLPPGPPTLPFIGNIHMIPRAGIHLKYTQWAKKYGPIFSLKIGQGTMVILSSAFHATQLLDKRSSHYSNRPPSHVIGERVFEGDHPMFMDADERWKLRRKLYFQLLQESRCNKEHVALIEAETTQLLQDICLDPGSLMFHPGRFSNSIIMSLVFGIRTPTHDTPHYLELREIVTELSALGEIGATPPVDVLSALKYIPERLWGNWKTRARLLRKRIFDLHSPLVDRVIERRAKIGKSKSFLDGVLDQQDKLKLTKDEIDIMCGNLLEGGTDTMGTLILTLCQAMATNQHVLEEAHKQIDSAVNDSRLPSWTDYDRLPYVAMIVKELHRWRSPAPAGFPHALDEDDEIDGMRIPKSSAVILNIWAIHNDPTRYENPDDFNPSRFQGQTQLAPVYANSSDHAKKDHFGYGAGRRICPGIHLAERALFLATARILWAFKIQPKVDAGGKPIAVDVSPETGYRDGFLNQCHPFEVDIKVRSEKRRETILMAAAKAEVETFSAYS